VTTSQTALRGTGLEGMSTRRAKRHLKRLAPGWRPETHGP
jgi:hypothetical protein